MSALASTTVLGKRKTTSNTSDTLVLRLTSPSFSYSGSERDEGSSYEAPEPLCVNPSLLLNPPIPSSPKDTLNALGPSSLISRSDFVKSGDGKLQCMFDGCNKAYRKHSRLEEHFRSHTGERPFVCGTCSRSYFRENHLQAHARTHLPAADKSFACPEDDCGKRFWTAQHLRAHEQSVHKGEKTFKCAEEGCDKAFAKHNQLRTHICEAHSPPGTKPYRCEHEGCKRSFLTNQKLQTHMKVHDDARYTCTHVDCLLATSPEGELVFFPTWSALQYHIRTTHPAKCPYPECADRTFTSQKGLRGHVKLHEMRKIEAELGLQSDADEEVSERGDGPPPRKRRRGGELGRDWKCDVESCGKDFKSKKALKTHHHVSHLNRRDFVCPHVHCGRAFGYKHLLQRHLARLHAPPATASSSSSDDEADDEDHQTDGSTTAADVIGRITGATYSRIAQTRVQNAQALRCQHPHLPAGWVVESSVNMGGGSSRSCEYVFSRAYDWRRHLEAEHGVIAPKTNVDAWVANAKKALRRA